MTAVEGFRRNSPAAAPRAGAAPDRARLALPVVLYFLTVLLPVQFNVGPLAMTGTRLILLVLVVPLTLRLLAGAYDGVRMADVFFFLHLLWATVALAVNNPDRVVQNAGSTGIEFLGGYLLGRAYIRNAASFSALIRFLAIAVVVTFPLALYETLTGTSLILKTLDGLPGIRSIADLSIGKRLGLDRVQLAFAHPIHYGLFCTMAMSLVFIGLKQSYPLGRRLLIGAITLASGVLALSSGALLAIVLQLGLIAWATVFHGVKARWWILTALFVTAYVTIDLISNRSAMKVFLSYATFSASTAYWRMLIFEFGMDNVWANPIFGLGLNDWVRPYWMYSGSMDNFWLVMAVRYGIPGFLLLAIGYLWTLWRIGTRDFDGSPLLWNFRRAWMFSFVGLTFTLSTVHIWGSIYSVVFFVFGAGMWLLSADKDATGTEAEAALSPADQARKGPSYTRFPNTSRRGSFSGHVPLSQPVAGR